MPLVTMPDGQLVDMPDNPTAEQLEGLRKIAEPGVMETVKRWAGDVGRGAMTNAAFLVEGVGRLPAYRMLDSAVQAISDGKVAAVTPEMKDGALIKSAASVIPKTQDGYGTAIREGLGGWASLPMGGAAGAVSSMTAAAGSEGASKLFGDSMLSKLLGGLAGGVAGGSAMSRAASRLSPQASEIAKKSLEGISPSMLQEAELFQKSAATKGIQVDLAQALEAVGAPSTNLTTIRNVLASRTGGEKVQQVLREQPGQLSVEASQVAARLPGENYGVAQSANNLQQAATERVKLAQKTRSGVWQDTLESSKQALTDAAEARLSMVGQQTGAATQQVEAATARLQQLQQVLEKAKNGDAAAVVKANAAVAESRKLVENLKTFSLPRGGAADSRGRLLGEPRRGESIVNDQVTRDVQGGSLESTILPNVEAAPSLPTLQAQQAVEGAQQGLTTAQQASTAAQKSLASAEGQLASITIVPDAAVLRAQSNLIKLADQFPNTRQGMMLRSIAGKLQTGDGLVTDPNALNLILREASAKLKDPSLAAKGIDTTAAKAIGEAITKTRTDLGTAFKPLKEANAAYSQFTSEVIDPLKQGPVGQFAAKGYDPAMQANMTKFESLMKEGVDANSKNSPIRTLARELAKVDPNAVPDALKAYVSKNIQKAMEPGATSKTAANNPDMAHRIADNLFGNELQAQGLRDAVAESAKSLGQNSAEMVKGLNHFMQITKALKSTTPVGGLQAAEVAKLGGKTLSADFLRAFGFMPFARAAMRLEDTVLGHTLRQLDTILTSPDGAKLLVELGKVDPTSKRAAMLISTMAGTAATNPVGVTDE